MENRFSRTDIIKWFKYKTCIYSCWNTDVKLFSLESYLDKCVFGVIDHIVSLPCIFCPVHVCLPEAADNFLSYSRPFSFGIHDKNVFPRIRIS